MAKTPQFHLLNTLSQALAEVFEKDKNADRMIDKYLRANPKWAAEERSFFAESLYEIVRNRRLLIHVGESEEIFHLIGSYLVCENYKLPIRKEFEKLNADAILRRQKENKPLAVEFSFPDWLNELGEKEFQTEWPAIMRALNQPPSVYLRVNTLKSATDKLLEFLKQEKMPAEPVKFGKENIPNCVRLRERTNIFATTAFKSGAFEMQDAGSQMIAPLLDPQPGDRVVDACAGSGGKTLHLAALMKNSGKILAMDVHDWKLKDLLQRTQRAGVKIVETKLITSPKIIKQLENSFDRVLIDAPCSGLGVLRRNPDSKWKLNLNEIDSAVMLQKEILSKYSEMCKSGGTLVYATCSILNRENENQVKVFLSSAAGKNWKLQNEVRIWPHKHGFDGFYAAVLKKN